MSRRVGFLVLLLSLSLCPWAAQAKNLHGKFGVGFQRSLLGVQGFSFTYWMTPKLAFLTTAGIGFDRATIHRQKEVSGADGTVTTEIQESESWSTRLLAAAGVKYVLYGTKYANLSFGALLDLGWANKLVYDAGTVVDAMGNAQVVQATSSNRLQWGLELPMEVEFFFSDAFSINLAAGMFVTVVPDAPSNYTAGSANASILSPTGLGEVSEPGEVGIAIGGGGLFGQAGFTFYF
jgi:hypothetical protein